MAPSPSPSPYPPSHYVTFHYDDGDEFDVSITQLDNFEQYNVRLCINYGCQLGASIIVLIILLLLTKPQKRKSVVFTLNASALCFNIARLVCEVVYFTSSWREVYSYFTFDFSRVHTRDYANSVLIIVFSVFLLICVESSLVLQIQVLCTTLRRRYRFMLLAFSYLVAVVCVAFRIWLAVDNSIYIVRGTFSTNLIWLEIANNIVLTVGTFWFCAVFVAKLAYAIRLQKRLGIKKFGPMKAVFIMGCQTMIVPLLFSVLQYAVTVPELSANCITIITISLPLSSLWAGCTLESNKNKNDNNNNAPSPGRDSASSRYPLWNMGSSSTARTVCYTNRNQQRDLETGKGINVAHDVSILNSTKNDSNRKTHGVNVSVD